MKHNSSSPKIQEIKKTQINILEDFITSCNNRGNVVCHFDNSELHSIMNKNNTDKILFKYSHSEMDNIFSKLIKEKSAKLKDKIDGNYLRFIFSKGLALLDQTNEAEFERNIGVQYVNNTENTLSVEDLRYRHNNDKKNFLD